MDSNVSLNNMRKKVAGKVTTTRIGPAFVVGCLAIGLSQQAVAHHGWVAHYDREQYVTIRGVVKDVQFVNPHAYVYIDTVNENGEPEVRWCEMQARTQLQRRGVTYCSRITIASNTLRSGAS